VLAGIKMISVLLIAAGALSIGPIGQPDRPPDGTHQPDRPPDEVHQPGGRADPAALSYLQIAEQGVVRAERTWRDHNRGWYDERLDDRAPYPLATIWGAAPLFEALAAIDIAAPSAAHRAAVVAFADGAERYYDRGLRPTPGYAPYPGDRGQAETWFDDNGWWGIAFMDAYRATASARYRRDAERAFTFIATQGWDAAGGGLWWNTHHTYRAGEALAADTLLGALLYSSTHRSYYLDQVDRFLTWADAHFLTEMELYARTDSDPTPTPYVEGPLVEAHQLLCQAGVQPACARAQQLADACWRRFEARLNMGPQFDTIYLHWMLVYATQTGDQRWPALAMEMAADAQSNALEPQRDLYLSAWDGSPITAHEAQPGMLQTDAATLELFAWLAADGASA
jgi:hypothetical protein